MKVLLVFAMLMSFLIGCAHSQREELKCPDTSAERLVARIQGIPVDKWKRRYYESTFYFEDGDIDVGVSRSGNLFIDRAYIHLPWELKLELQRFWKRLECSYSKGIHKREPIRKTLDLLDKI